MKKYTIISCTCGDKDYFNNHNGKKGILFKRAIGMLGVYFIMLLKKSDPYNYCIASKIR